MSIFSKKLIFLGIIETKDIGSELTKIYDAYITKILFIWTTGFNHEFK